MDSNPLEWGYSPDEEEARRNEDLDGLYADAMEMREERDQWIRYAIALEARLMDLNDVATLARLRGEFF